MRRHTVRVVAVAAVLLTGACGGGDDEAQTTTTAPATTTATTAAPTTEATTTTAAAPVVQAAGPDSVIADVPVAEHVLTLDEGTRNTSDMAAGGAGLWAAMRGPRDTEINGLIQIDPESGAMLQAIAIDRPLNVAVSTNAVWADSGDGMIRVDAATGETTPSDLDLPSAWGDQVWATDDDGQGWRLDEATGDPLYAATITTDLVQDVLPDFDRPGPHPIGNIVPGPDTGWAIEFGLGIVEFDIDTGEAIRVTAQGDHDFGETAVATADGIWILAEDEETEEIVALFVETGSAGYARRHVLPDPASEFDDLAADEQYVYVLGQEGPLWVIDAANGAVLATIDHEEFIDNAYAVALANGAVWVAVQNDLLLEYRP